MAQSIYGGRVDNEFDQRLLNTFLERLFTTRSFDSEFKLACKVDGHKDIQMPDGIRREEFVQWVELLPDAQTPSWLGLPNNAERVLLTTQGVDMISKMLKMQMLEDEDDLAYAETEKKTRTDSTSDGRPAWMRTLHTTASNWLHLIPQTLSPLKRTVENIKDPLFRFFEREVKMGAKLLQDVRQDLADVVQVCEGKKKQTNYLRTLINELVKGILPRSWSHYTVPAGMTVIQWVSDFSERIKQLQNISQAAAAGGAKELKNIHVCLGGLFVPEAYITATRQYVAQANSWSLEELCLEVNVTASQSTTLDACSFGVTGELESERGQAFLWNLFPNECTECLARAAQLSLRVSRKLGCVALDSFSPVSTSPHRSEAPRGHVQQQQTLAVQCDLHSPPPHTATLGKAN